MFNYYLNKNSDLKYSCMIKVKLPGILISMAISTDAAYNFLLNTYPS